ncbi:hypothetical protein [Flaviaesturariibacter aridisoli]|uniref:Uncharacterized protein n=1 Tax=Flaviaesturariibacter aridisoli TaxID=2545761 RepID=A0A4R4E5A6_9BACT|nr:hypothetical protein [Flaviaesturariibacter aridisoli]TCZ72818.1 hypothetical protein E0486_08545 [Flaviaesturariibacter aridisoli]
MTLFDFKLLPAMEQLDLLYEQGSFIGKRKVAAQTCVLYQLESFYVEVLYRQYRRIPEKLHCFRSTALLDPYLELIDVEHWVI